jgi:predicted ATPase
VLWKDHDATRIELSKFGDDTIDELLRRVLGGPIDAASVRLVADYTRGDPLFVREVIAGALENQALTDESGVWRVRGPLQPTPRLVELVNLRLGRLSELERRALELTAIGEPLAQPALDELTERAAVEALEDKGLLTRNWLASQVGRLGNRSTGWSAGRSGNRSSDAPERGF